MFTATNSCKMKQVYMLANPSVTCLYSLTIALELLDLGGNTHTDRAFLNKSTRLSYSATDQLSPSKKLMLLLKMQEMLTVLTQ